MKLTVQEKILISFVFLLSLLLLAVAFGYSVFSASIFLKSLIVAFVVIILLAVILSIKITKPLSKLRESAESLENGQLSTKFNIESDDEIETISGSFTNIVKQLLREEKTLTHNKIETEALLKSLTDGVITLDEKGNIIAFNKAAEETSGFAASAVIGKNIDEVLHFYDALALVPFFVYNQQKEEVVKKFREKGLNLNRADGTKVRLALTTSPVVFEDKKTGFIVAFHDISKEEELEEMKLDFVSIAAHELRTPLTAIRGYTSILEMQNSKELNQSGKELLKRLVISSENLGNLVENLLSVSRIEKSIFSINMKPSDLVPAIKTAVDNVRPQATVKQQTITVMVPDQLPVVLGDVFRLGQVILNFIANAVNYTQKGGVITVKAERKDSTLQVSVIDNGQGIPKASQEKLFTKFFRASGALESGAKGTGLGLYISKSIIESHKGKIWVESEEGKGSTFAFSLPIASASDIETYEKTHNQTVAQMLTNQPVSKT